MKKIIYAIQLFIIFFMLGLLYANAQESKNSQPPDSASKTYLLVEKMPEFEGGLQGLAAYVRKNVLYPVGALEANIQGIVQISFFVDSTGQVKNIYLIHSLGFGCSEAVLKCFRAMPKWNPGVHNDMNVNVQMGIPPIVFSKYYGVYLDTSALNNAHSTTRPAISIIDQSPAINAAIFQRAGMNYSDAISKLNYNDFKGAIKSLDKELFADPFEVYSLYLRGLTYFKLKDYEHACIDLRLAAYLYFFDTDSLIIPYIQCDPLFYYNKDNFLDSFLCVAPLWKSEKNIENYYDSLPQFPGGTDSLYSFFGKNFKYSNSPNLMGSHGRVIVCFEISETGNISNPEVVNSSKAKLIEEEALRLTALMPAWKPAYKNGLPVKSKCLFPVINLRTKKSLYLSKVNDDYNEGVRLLKDSRYEDAITSFNKAIETNPLDLDAIYNRGISYLKLQDTLNACKDWSYAVYYNDRAAIKPINKYCDSLVIIYDDTLHTNLFEIKFNEKNYPSFLNPEFVGGDSALNKYVFENLIKKFHLGGHKIQIRFIISLTGEVTHVRLLPRYIDDSWNKKIEEEFRKMPKWIPGKINDTPSDMIWNYWINFY